MTRVVLASASPRRRELLSALLDDFEVVAANVEEELTEEPRADALRLAAAKATAIASGDGATLVIGSDTVVHDGVRSYGKPDTPAEAVAMLTSLRGRPHMVTTGIAVAMDGLAETDAPESRVWLSDLSDDAIAAYVASGRPMDKAGAYAIQDEDVPTVSRFEGCYCNVVGLPLWRLRALLQERGVPCRKPSDTYARCRDCPDRPQSGEE